MVVSFLENNNFEKHNIYWLYVDVRQNVIDEFCDFFEKKYNQIITPFKMTKDMLTGFYSDAVFGAAAFHKLFVFKYLNLPGGRVLSLDADAIINGSLKDFYYQEMDQYCIAASQDLYIRKTDESYITHKLGLSKDYIYINLGNTLYDLKKYFNEKTVEEYAMYIKENPDKLKYVSQDIINVLLGSKIKVCDAYTYNLQIYSEMNLKFSSLYLINDDSGKKIRQAIKQQPLIIHYVRRIKPWETEYIFGNRSFFKKYERITFGEIFVLKSDFKRICSFIKRIVKKCLK